MKQPLRCACNKSKKMPWCDGSHSTEDWACEATAQPSIDRAFIGVLGLQNLLTRLAWRFDGQLLQDPAAVKVKQLVIFEDGSGLNQLTNHLNQLNVEQVYFVGIDLPTERIAQQFNFTDHIQITGELSDSFVQLEQQFDHWFNGKPIAKPPIPISQSQCQALNHIFISHSVDDEQFLLPIVTAIRQTTALEVFLCFDSIGRGEKWRRAINSALDQSELFVFIISKSSVASTYCAFETGCALTQNKHICLISIDGSLPPAYISHLHCIDLQREINAQPWLDLDTGVLSHILAFSEQVCIHQE